MNNMTKKLESDEMIFIPYIVFERWFNELTAEDLKRFDVRLVEYLKVRKLISTGKILKVNDKTVFKFLKLCQTDLEERGILKAC
jgi:hypothetical protein